MSQPVTRQSSVIGSKYSVTLKLLLHDVEAGVEHEHFY